MSWRLYRVRGAGEPRLYIGITSQRAPYARLQQHVGDLAGDVAGGRRVAPKWWAPLATGWDLDPAVYATKADAEKADARAIRAERPRCNVMHNQGNPDRWRSMADVPLHLRPVVLAASVGGPAPIVRRRDPRRARRFALATVAVVWLGVFIAFDSVSHEPGTSAAMTVLAYGVTYRHAGRRRRRRVRR